jgi:flagellar biosynthesis GTPase FlhF
MEQTKPFSVVNEEPMQDQKSTQMSQFDQTTGKDLSLPVSELETKAEPEPEPESNHMEQKEHMSQVDQSVQATDEIALREKEIEERHAGNLSQKEEIEIKQLELGVSHESAGQDQHAKEAYQHERVNNEREEMIRKQELERRVQEDEVRRLEEVRIRQEMERAQREQQDIIQQENSKISMDNHAHQKSEVHDWQHSNDSNKLNITNFTSLLISLIIANVLTYMR